MLEIAHDYRYLSMASLATCESNNKSVAHSVAQHIARIAVRSLYAELVLYPKPGLVSLRDNGSHTDMDAACFMRSLFSLRHYFRSIALAGAAGADFKVLRQLGIAAEQRMLKATKGINTHRGAIFALGMLSASAGYCLLRERVLSTATLRQALLSCWGQALAVHSVPDDRQGLSHGLQAARIYAACGAREEAALGFPSIFELALPRLQQSLQEGRSPYLAQLDCFFTLMAHISDTNLYHRGGAAGIAYAREAAQQFLEQGGTANPQCLRMAEQHHQEFIVRRLSPGGAADMLAASCFVQQCLEEFSAVGKHE